MAILSVVPSNEYSYPVRPADIFISTSDNLVTVMGLGYLNGSDVTYGITYSNDLIALVLTTDGLSWLSISVDGSNISLVPPLVPLTTLMTSPPSSQSSSLELGAAYQNTFGYDIMLSVYVNVASASAASFLLGVGPTNTPTQQTIISSLTLLSLSVIPVNIYIPNNYYAKLSTSGTISASIGGQIAMPI